MLSANTLINQRGHTLLSLLCPSPNGHDHPAAAGRRYIATNETLWMREIAVCLKAALSAEESRRVSVRPLLDWVIRIAARFSSEAAFIAKSLGKDIKYDSSKARTELGWKARPAHKHC